MCFVLCTPYTRFESLIHSEYRCWDNTDLQGSLSPSELTNSMKMLIASSHQQLHICSRTWFRQGANSRTGIFIIVFASNRLCAPHPAKPITIVERVKLVAEFDGVHQCQLQKLETLRSSSTETVPARAPIPVNKIGESKPDRRWRAW